VLRTIWTLLGLLILAGLGGILGHGL